MAGNPDPQDVMSTDYDETFPDMGAMSDQELKDLINELTEEEREVSYRRRVLHGKIDIMRAELVNRLKVKREAGDATISGADVAAAHRHPARQGAVAAGGRVLGGLVVGKELIRWRLHCPECGFVNPEGANYCQKCGAFLGRPEGGEEPSTMTYKVDETGEYTPIDIDEEVDKTGAALVIRSGGGRAGESFPIDQERMSIGRTPDAAVFLDDVTVSRNHALAGSAPGRLLHRRSRLAERHLRQPAPDRVARARGRRRDPDRQIQAQLPGAVRGSRWL